MSLLLQPNLVSLREWKRLTLWFGIPWNAHRLWIIIEWRIFFKDIRLKTTKKIISSPPSSPSQIFCINDRLKLLQDFLAKNCAHTTLVVPHFKTPIRAKRMLELHFQIVEQLVTLRSIVESIGRASSLSRRSSTCGRSEQHQKYILHCSHILSMLSALLKMHTIGINFPQMFTLVVQHARARHVTSHKCWIAQILLLIFLFDIFQSLGFMGS
jgi:hypothetical protein